MDDLALALDDGAPMPLHRQVYDGLRAAILSGRLRPGVRLPSTRALAERLGLSRNTVARAFDDLASEGYLHGRLGAGTFVSAALAAAGDEPGTDAIAAATLPPTAEPCPGASVLSTGTSHTVSGRFGPAAARRPASPARLSAWAGRAFEGLDEVAGSPVDVADDFRPGTPDWDAFPRRIWWRLLGRRLRSGADLRRYGDPAGFPLLREAIARHVSVSRAVVCRPEQVVIVNGTQQAIDLLARLLLEPGDEVVLEEPGYPEARRIFHAYGGLICPTPVDGRGLRTDALPDRSRQRFVYVTPSHQFPTGATLALDRRLALLDWADRQGALVIEDDYDSEFRYAGRPIESLQGLDRSGRVIYVGTFSSVLFPPLRVGYAILPEHLVAPFVRAKWLADRGTGMLEQQALADFIVEGHFARHLRRMRRLGRARRDALLAALARHLGGHVTVPAADTGMHVMARLPGRDGDDIVRAARQRGLGVYSGNPCYALGRPDDGALLLGFGAVPEAAIDDGVRRLAVAIDATSIRVVKRLDDRADGPALTDWPR